MSRLLTCAALAAIVSAVSAVSVVAQEALPRMGADKTAVVPAAQAEVPVRVVVLYSSGVGYFEHHGNVEGNTSAELRFKTAQINDLLKSLVLQDLDKGQVTAITYPSQDPLAKLLKSFQVDVSGNLSRSDLLKQLRGAKVTCQQIDGKVASGTILGVEIEKVPTGEKGDLQEIPVLNLLSEQGVTNVRLPAVQSISFDDKRLQEELTKALSALAQARDQDKKAVTIQFAGDGKRRVKLGYVIETPVWKTSYRLLLGDDKDTKPFVQGWAIVENQTDQDWNSIQLSLVSGRPISFVQDLYQPLYIPRPVVQPELFASLNPQAYEGGMNLGIPAAPGMMEMAADNKEVGSSGGRQASRKSSAAAPMAALAMSDARADTLEFRAVASAASASNLGELFQYTVGVPVSLARQKSAMFPIIADAIGAQKVSIYNASVLPKYPLNGAILTNTTGKHLLQGPITVLDNGAYGGDARIQDFPPDQKRLISYGIDLKVLVDSTSARNEDTIRTGKIVKGVLNISRKNVFTQEYKIENKAKVDKTIVIEHPFRQNWKLASEAKPYETTDVLYRFQVPSPAGKAAVLKVQEENVDWQAYAILPFDIDSLLYYSRQSAIPQGVRDALVKASQLKQQQVALQQQLEQTQKKVGATSQSQQRTRENLKAIGAQAQAGDYYNRLLKRMADQDAQIDTLQKTQDDQQQQLNAKQKELEDYLNALSVE